MEREEESTDKYNVNGNSDANPSKWDEVSPKPLGSAKRRIRINPALNLDGIFDDDSDDADLDQEQSLFTRFNIVNIKTENKNVKREETTVVKDERDNLADTNNARSALYSFSNQDDCVVISDSDDEQMEELTQMMSQSYEVNDPNSPQVISDDEEDKTASENDDDDDGFEQLDWESLLLETKPSVEAMNYEEKEDTADEADNEDNCDVDDDVTKGAKKITEVASTACYNDNQQFMLPAQRNLKQNTIKSIENSDRLKQLRGNDYTQFMFCGREGQVRDTREITESTTQIELPDLVPGETFEDSDDFSQSLLSGKVRLENQPGCYLSANEKQIKEKPSQTASSLQMSRPVKPSEARPGCHFYSQQVNTPNTSAFQFNSQSVPRLPSQANREATSLFTSKAYSNPPDRSRLSLSRTNAVCTPVSSRTFTWDKKCTQPNVDNKDSNIRSFQSQVTVMHKPISKPTETASRFILSQPDPQRNEHAGITIARTYKWPGQESSTTSRSTESVETQDMSTRQSETQSDEHHDSHSMLQPANKDQHSGRNSPYAGEATVCLDNEINKNSRPKLIHPSPPKCTTSFESQSNTSYRFSQGLETSAKKFLWNKESSQSIKIGAPVAQSSPLSDVTANKEISTTIIPNNSLSPRRSLFYNDPDDSTQKKSSFQTEADNTTEKMSLFQNESNYTTEKRAMASERKKRVLSVDSNASTISDTNQVEVVPMSDEDLFAEGRTSSTRVTSRVTSVDSNASTISETDKVDTVPETDEEMIVDPRRPASQRMERVASANSNASTISYPDQVDVVPMSDEDMFADSSRPTLERIKTAVSVDSNASTISDSNRANPVSDEDMFADSQEDNTLTDIPNIGEVQPHDETVTSVQHTEGFAMHDFEEYSQRFESETSDVEENGMAIAATQPFDFQPEYIAILSSDESDTNDQNRTVKEGNERADNISEVSDLEQLTIEGKSADRLENKAENISEKSEETGMVVGLDCSNLKEAQKDKCERAVSTVNSDVLTVESTFQARMASVASSLVDAIQRVQGKNADETQHRKTQNYEYRESSDEDSYKTAPTSLIGSPFIQRNNNTKKTVVKSEEDGLLPSEKSPEYVIAPISAINSGSAKITLIQKVDTKKKIKQRTDRLWDKLMNGESMKIHQLDTIESNKPISWQEHFQPVLKVKKVETIPEMYRYRSHKKRSKEKREKYRRIQRPESSSETESDSVIALLSSKDDEVETPPEDLPEDARNRIKGKPYSENVFHAMQGLEPNKYTMTSSSSADEATGKARKIEAERANEKGFKKIQSKENQNQENITKGLKQLSAIFKNKSTNKTNSSDKSEIENKAESKEDIYRKEHDVSKRPKTYKTVSDDEMSLSSDDRMTDHSDNLRAKSKSKSNRRKSQDEDVSKAVHKNRKYDRTNSAAMADLFGCDSDDSEDDMNPIVMAQKGSDQGTDSDSSSGLDDSMMLTQFDFRNKPLPSSAHKRSFSGPLSKKLKLTPFKYSHSIKKDRTKIQSIAGEKQKDAEIARPFEGNEEFELPDLDFENNGEARTMPAKRKETKRRTSDEFSLHGPIGVSSNRKDIDVINIETGLTDVSMELQSDVSLEIVDPNPASVQRVQPRAIPTSPESDTESSDAFVTFSKDSFKKSIKTYSKSSKKVTFKSENHAEKSDKSTRNKENSGGTFKHPAANFYSTSRTKSAEQREQPLVPTTKSNRDIGSDRWYTKQDSRNVTASKKSYPTFSAVQKEKKRRGKAKELEREERESDAIRKARLELLKRTRKKRLAEVAKKRKRPDPQEATGSDLDRSQLLEPEEAQKYDLSVGHRDCFPASQLDLDNPNDSRTIFFAKPFAKPSTYTIITTSAITTTAARPSMGPPPLVTYMRGSKPRSPAEPVTSQSVAKPSTSSKLSSHGSNSRQSRDAKVIPRPGKDQKIKSRDYDSSKTITSSPQSRSAAQTVVTSSLGTAPITSVISTTSNLNNLNVASVEKSVSDKPKRTKDSSNINIDRISPVPMDIETHLENEPLNIKNLRPGVYTERTESREQAADLISDLVKRTSSVKQAAAQDNDLKRQEASKGDKPESGTGPDYMATIPSPIKKNILRRDSSRNTENVPPLSKETAMNKASAAPSRSSSARYPISIQASHTSHSGHPNTSRASHTSHSVSKPSLPVQSRHREPSRQQSTSTLSSKMADELQRQEHEREWMERKMKEQERGKTRFSELPPCRVKPAKTYTVNEFYQRILRWNPLWFEEQANNKENKPPPLVGNEDPHCPLLLSYDTYDDYVRTMQVPFLYETWESMFKSWREKRAHDRPDKFTGFIMTPPDINRLSVITIQASYPATNTSCSLKEMDIIKMKMKDVSQKEIQQDKNQTVTSIRFGLVTKVERIDRRSKITDIFPCLKPMVNKADKVVVQIQVKLFLRNKWPTSSPLFIQRVDSLTTQVRQYEALTFLHHSPLARDLLRPCNVHVFHHQANVVAKHNSRIRMNESQQAAVDNVVDAVSQPYTLPKICLLQGPPGTGKSTVIAAIIEKLLAVGKTKQKNHKILLCAPSNAGVDEMARKLILKHKVLDNGDLNLVRIGAPEKINSDIAPYSLENAVTRKTQEVMQKKMERLKMTSLGSAIQDLDTKIKMAQDQMRLCRLQGKPEQVEVHRKELDKLNKKKKNISTPQSNNCRGPTREEEVQTRRFVLQNASVVCCTLNTAAKRQLLDELQWTTGQSPLQTLRPNTHAPKNRTPHFTCVIIDEAAQSSELDSLIALQYYTSKLVLVGDPKQLPSTVLSQVHAMSAHPLQKAKNLNYGQSLYERLYEFIQSPTGPQPVRMLDTQYRMHREICHFPSKHVYNRKLHTDSKVAQERTRFCYKPYLIFDIPYAKEEQRGTSTLNHEEVAVVVSLLKHVSQKVKPENIGVITPYKAQVLEIRRQISNKLEKVSVDTVDGFQGCEKDVIIISTVRANTRHVGFLSDERRMNVALTRAKFALYVVCNFSALKTDENWAALVGDAVERKVAVSVKQRRDMQHVVETSLRLRRDNKTDK